MICDFICDCIVYNTELTPIGSMKWDGLVVLPMPLW